ncbi:MAG: hypothetical protein ACKVQJ_05815 [Pyrinomonadaceae bacterium]
MKNALTICTLISAFCGVRMAPGQVAPLPYSDTEAYAVYSFVMRDEWPARAAKAKKLVIQTETTDFPRFGNDKTDCLAPAKGEEATYAPVIAAYRELNKKSWLLQPKFDASIPFQIVPKASIEDLFTRKGIDGWNDFYAKYPDSGGAISMSAVGFNADKTIAIVYMGHSCGGLCGGGNYHVLRKTDGKWSEIRWLGLTCSWAS